MISRFFSSWQLFVREKVISANYPFEPVDVISLVTIISCRAQYEVSLVSASLPHYSFALEAFNVLYLGSTQLAIIQIELSSKLNSRCKVIQLERTFVLVDSRFRNMAKFY